MKDSNTHSWQVEHHCPQCGAPVTLDENDRVLSCGFCRVRLYMVAGDCFRYYLPPSDRVDPGGGELLLVPYWRFKGLVYSCTRSFELKEKHVDTARLATARYPLLPSLGYRQQASILRFASGTAPGVFVEPDLSYRRLVRDVDELFRFVKEFPAREYHRAFIGETLSLIYLPVLARDHQGARTLTDGITGRTLCRLDDCPDDSADLAHAADEAPWDLTFVPTLCPQCSWDLEGESDSLVLHCSNCESAWIAAGTHLKRLTFAVCDAEEEGAVFLPFWRIRPRVSGVQLETYGDVVRLANIPKVLHPEEQRAEFTYWCPAFKLTSPRLLMRFARHMTASQPQKELEYDRLPASRYPVTLPASEAVQAFHVTVASLAVRKQEIFPLLSEMTMEPEETLLVYYPFHMIGSECVQQEMSLSIPRNALRWSRKM